MAKDKQRIQFDFSEKEVARLDALVESGDFSTRAAVLRRALEVYAVLVEAAHNECRVTVYDTQGKIIFAFPAKTIV